MLQARRCTTEVELLGDGEERAEVTELYETTDSTYR